jgi:hypothetical protein
MANIISNLNGVYMLERRNADGSLSFDDPQPPFIMGTGIAIFDLYFKAHPDANDCGHAQLLAWLATQQWSCRPVTWPVNRQMVQR